MKFNDSFEFVNVAAEPAVLLELDVLKQLLQN